MAGGHSIPWVAGSGWLVEGCIEARSGSSVGCRGTRDDLASQETSVLAWQATCGLGWEMTGPGSSQETSGHPEPCQETWDGAGHWGHACPEGGRGVRSAEGGA